MLAFAHLVLFPLLCLFFLPDFEIASQFYVSLRLEIVVLRTANAEVVTVLQADRRTSQISYVFQFHCGLLVLFSRRVGRFRVQDFPAKLMRHMFHKLEFSFGGKSLQAGVQFTQRFALESVFLRIVVSFGLCVAPAETHHICVIVKLLWLVKSLQHE